jgi:tetratricopeptide (TPR) repeat protein
MALHDKILKTLKSSRDPEYDSTWCLRTYGQVCQSAGKLDQADQLLREALELERKHKDCLARRQGIANTLGFLALNLLLQQRYDEAEPHVREAIATFEKQRPDGIRRFYWISLFGAVRLGQQRYAEAEPLLLQGYEGMKQRVAIHAGERRRLIEAGAWIVRFYEATNQPEKARLWRDKVNPKLPASDSVK